MTKSLAARFHHCPACGAAKDDAGSNPFRCFNADCQFVFYFSPTTAVGAFVRNDDGRTLFIQRAKDPGKGMLGLPGGFVDPGESLEEAIRREVFEETNLELTSATYLTSFPNKYVYRGSAIDVTDMFFLGNVETFENIRSRDGEAADFLLEYPSDEILGRLAFASNKLALRFYRDKYPFEPNDEKG